MNKISLVSFDQVRQIQNQLLGDTWTAINQMSTEISFIYGIGQKILVKEIQRPGVVTCMRVTSFGKECLVAYWNDGNRKEEWMYEWELEPRGQV